MEPGRGFEPRRLMPEVFETPAVPLGYPGDYLDIVLKVYMKLKNSSINLNKLKTDIFPTSTAWTTFNSTFRTNE